MGVEILQPAQQRAKIDAIHDAQSAEAYLTSKSDFFIFKKIIMLNYF
ncbi:MAG TPA: hypothetical protein VG965_04225 [Patescibacteria group bacterium]|nr:hypothetical protein [Patescibacteria group bacterium]